jgi:MOSC domain-containing protein YiiM
MTDDSRNVPARIFQINSSNGGVPKLARLEAFVSAEGLLGDRQNSPTGHGGPERALVLYPLENILALQAEGHPIFPGAAGENLTLVGLDWESLAPGVRLQLGDVVQIELTRFITPCSTLQPFFIDGKFERIYQEKQPGWSRLGARVLQVGMLKVGDPVRVL